MSTVMVNKKALVNYDDKRAAVDEVNTLAWGHCNMPLELKTLMS